MWTVLLVMLMACSGGMHDAAPPAAGSLLGDIKHGEVAQINGKELGTAVAEAQDRFDLCSEGKRWNPKGEQGIILSMVVTHNGHVTCRVMSSDIDNPTFRRCVCAVAGNLPLSKPPPGYAFSGGYIIVKF